MDAKKILITGANGLVGFEIVIKALKAGYHVRAAVRQASAKQLVTTARSIQPYLKSLDVILVPDMTEPGAFDAAACGVDYIIHVAFPMVNGPVAYYPDLIDPGVQMTSELLKSAAKAGSVKRFILTSSIAVLGSTGSRVLREDNLGPIPPKSEEIPSPPFAYFIGKKLQLEAAENFVQTTGPGFDLVTIMPGVVLGASELITTRAEFEKNTNRVVVMAARGIERGFAMACSTVHLGDVATLHVRALDPMIKGGSRFMLCTNNSWSDVKKIVEKRFPKEVASGLLPCTGVHETKPTKYDDSRTRGVFGEKWSSFEIQVTEVIQSWLDLEDN